MLVADHRANHGIGTRLPDRRSQLRLNVHGYLSGRPASKVPLRNFTSHDTRAPAAKKSRWVGTYRGVVMSPGLASQRAGWKINPD